MRRNDLSRRLLLGFAGLAALVAVGGCGGGGGSVSPTDFQAEANHVCRDAQDQFDRIVRATPRTADQAEKQAAALVDVSDQALDNLRRIEPPDDAKDAYERYLDARAKAIGFIEDARDAAADSDGGGYARAKRRLAADQPRRRQLAIAAGLRACSVPSASPGK